MTLSDCTNEQQSPVRCLCDSIIVPEAVRLEYRTELLNKAVVLRATSSGR
jgi:hypothetical protein